MDYKVTIIILLVIKIDTFPQIKNIISSLKESWKNEYKNNKM